jgi:hypothetical protein
MPRIERGNLVAIASPVVVDVYFSGETLQPAVDGFMSSWLASPVFASQLSEYGVKSGTAAPAIALTEAAASKLMEIDVVNWLAGKLDGTHPEFGPVDAATLASKIFVLFDPSTTTITFASGGTSCVNFAGYHEVIPVPGGNMANLAVVPRCKLMTSKTQIDELTFDTSVTVLGAITNPVPIMGQGAGWTGFDANHLGFDVSGGEVGTTCASLGYGPKPSGISGAIAFAWSNAASAAYHDPCLPAAPDPYYVAVPVTTSTVLLQTLGSATKGVQVPVKKSVTIDVQFLSDGPTSGPWSVSAESTLPGTFAYAFDQTKGQNGDVRHLTIIAPATPGEDIALIRSGPSGATRSFWLLPVLAR